MQWATQENWHDKLLTCNKTAHLCLISVKPTDQKVLSVWLHAKALQALTDLQAQEWMMTALSSNDNGLRTISTCRSLLCGALLCMGERCMQQRLCGNTCSRDLHGECRQC